MEHMVSKQKFDQGGYLYILKRKVTIQIPLKDILYVESRDRRLHVHTVSAVYDYNDRLVKLIDLLQPKGFVRCHQSFLVKLSAISVIRSDKLLVGNTEIPISRKYKGEVMKYLPSNEPANKGDKTFLSV